MLTWLCTTSCPRTLSPSCIGDLPASDPDNGQYVRNGPSVPHTGLPMSCDVEITCLRLLTKLCALMSITRISNAQVWKNSSRGEDGHHHRPLHAARDPVPAQDREGGWGEYPSKHQVPMHTRLIGYRWMSWRFKPPQAPTASYVVLRHAFSGRRALPQHLCCPSD